MPPQVLKAFHEAAQSACSLQELQYAASKRIQKHTGAEMGLVTAGCSAALTLGTAAILAGSSYTKMARLPWVDDGPNEFLIAREQRNGYDHAFRAAGAQLVEVGFNEIVANAGVRRTELWEYDEAITPRTAGIIYVAGDDTHPPLRDVVKLANDRCLPIIIDAAGEVLPRSRIREIVATFADVVCFSGGKAIRGPQSTGVLCGRYEPVTSAMMQMLDMDDHPSLWSLPTDTVSHFFYQYPPRHGLGRGYKVSKEEIIALLVAMDLFFDGEYLKERPQQIAWLEQIAKSLPNSATSRLHIPSDGERFPTLEIQLDEQRLGRSAFDVCKELRSGTPRIFVGHGLLGEGKFVIHPLCLQPGHADMISARLIEELR